MTASVQSLVDILDARYPAASAYYIALLSSAVQAGSTTWTVASNSFSGYTYVSGTRVRLSGTALPANASSTIDYYVLPGNQLSLTSGGAAVSFTSAGSGLTITEQPITANDSMAVLISKELTSYTTRISTTAAAATRTALAASKLFSTATVAPATAYTYRSLLLISGGAAGQGDITGTVANLDTLPADVTVTSPSTRIVTHNFTLEQL
jgi:hypothetical protein